MLTQALALDQLRNMVAWQTEPRLNDGELLTLLTRAAVFDVAGRGPGDDDWVPTYSPVMLNASAAEGWRWKAARLTSDRSGSKGDQTFSPEAQRRDMLDMAKEYQRKVAGTQRTYPFARLRENDTDSGAIAN